ncbi:hypothetical protein WMY93_026457 [Mugilogobius chulae]|uniref:DUF4430 domain-containing protein n=1 Tax=Mugilogobius chulae TaxID=88201 RepID=A0AAW0N2D2_9GOBI
MSDFTPYYVSKGRSDVNDTPISVSVINSVEPMPDKHYDTFVAFRGILLGALKRLEFTTDFNIESSNQSEGFSTGGGGIYRCEISECQASCAHSKTTNMATRADAGTVHLHGVPDYGPYLNSVNGLFEDRDKHTYWQLEVRKPDGKVIVPDVGIGCYIPEKDDEIILNYTKY